MMSESDVARNGLDLLAGLRVVSLEQYISGPYCTSILADLGAEVIKVERPPGGDPRREYEPRIGTGDDVISGGFASYNRGKKSVRLDLSTDEGRRDFATLVVTADVLVSNLRPGALDRLGWSAQTLRTRFESLIICEITGFGRTGGPYGAWPAFDSVIQAMSGLSSLLGDAPDAPPGMAPMGSMDILAGTWAALGILGALAKRTRTGRGCVIDAAMYDIAAAFLERPLTLHEFTGEMPIRGEDAYSPVGAFRAGDGGWISIVIPTDEMWLRCCRVLQTPELVADPQLDSVVKRAAHMKDRIIPLLEKWASRLTTTEAVAQLRAGGQPAGAVQTIAEVRSCPHLEHRQLFAELEGSPQGRRDSEPLRLPRTPLLFDGRGARPGPVPRFGEHTDEVLDSAQRTDVEGQQTDRSRRDRTR